MKYQDLVIKDGNFVGQFEKMYQQFEDPWNQTKEGYVENSISRQVVCNYINYFNIKSLVELGCGLGKTTNFIHQKTGIDIRGEKTGLVPTKSWKRKNIGKSWHVGETMITGVGQGYITSTPIQLALVTALIANNGKKIFPKINLDDFNLEKNVINVDMDEYLGGGVPGEIELKLSRLAFNLGYSF